MYLFMYLFCFLTFCVCLFVIFVPQGQLHNFLLSLFLKKYFIIIVFYFWLHWVFVATHGLSLVAASRGYFLCSCGGRASHCVSPLVVEHRL